MFNIDDQSQRTIWRGRAETGRCSHQFLENLEKQLLANKAAAAVTLIVSRLMVVRFLLSACCCWGKTWGVGEWKDENEQFPLLSETMATRRGEQQLKHGQQTAAVAGALLMMMMIVSASANRPSILACRRRRHRPSSLSFHTASSANASSTSANFPRLFGFNWT